VRYLYTVLLYLAMPFIFLRLLLRSRRLPAYRQRLGQRFGFYPFKLEKCIWVHAVSVGEVIAAIPLIKALKNKYPDIPLLITNMTPTGAERVRAAFGDTVHQVYLPYDMPDAVYRFLNAMNPVMCIIMETEMWPNLLAACNRRNIPVCLTNARLSAKSASGYMMIKPLAREMFANVTRISACSTSDADRYAAFGTNTNQLAVTGNLKFDLMIADGLLEKAAALRNQLGKDRFVWIAASTHDGEEGTILFAHRKLREANKDALLILVPRHPERFNEIAELSAKYFKTERRSQTKDKNIDEDTGVYLGDTMGEMLVMYAAADVAMVAGSLIPRGGHNILEPAVFSKPIITGVHVFNFADICNTFEKANALIKVNNPEELAEQITHLMHEKEMRDAYGQRARAVMDANRGALDKQLYVIDGLMPR
jgi:3-deoxy-D-manno-octulosonic-acid transferase